jgi:hypothetical protein
MGTEDAPAFNTSNDHIYVPPGERYHYVAWSVCRLRNSRALAPETAKYLEDFHQRTVNFITCLVNPKDERFTYDLRIVSRPDAEAYTRGKVTLALLCRMEGLPLSQSRRYGKELVTFAESCFSEYEFELENVETIPWLLCPFEIGHIVAAGRRCSKEALDTLTAGDRLRKRLGFGEASDSSNERSSGGETILHIFPYIPRPVRLNAFFKLLLMQSAPLALSCRFRPTFLRPSEEKFLEGQIAACERHAQVSIGQIPERMQALHPTLREQARKYEQYQSRLLFGLSDNAALSTFEIASPDPIPHTIADAVGSLLSEPAGGAVPTAEDYFRYLAGGYEVIDFGVDPDAIQAFERIEMRLPKHPVVPAEAGRLLNLFDSVEAAAGLLLPPATLAPILGIETKQWLEQPAPPQLPSQGVLIGFSTTGGTPQPVRIGAEDRRRHAYIVGQTGTGKTTLLKTMILDDIRGGNGLCVVDPHGDLYKELLGKMPENRVKDVVLLNPTDVDFPVGLNVLEYETESQRHFLIQELVGIVARIIEDEYGVEAIGQFAGPVFFQHMRMNLLLAMSKPQDPGTLLEFYNIFQEEGYWKRWLPLCINDPYLERWVKHVLPKTNYLRPSSDGASMGGYVGSKFESFLFDPMLRNIFGQKRSTINLREIMDHGKILLVNLAKGEQTEANSRLLGMFLLAKLQAACMGRVGVPPAERRDFFVYVDEFQSIATQNFISLLSEGRKFGLTLILANQFVSQIKDSRIVASVLGNIGTVICFRLGQVDAESMEREFYPLFDRADLINLPNWHAYITTLVNGQTLHPFSLSTALDEIRFDEARSSQVLVESRRKYGKPSGDVRREVARSFREEAESPHIEQLNFSET